MKMVPELKPFGVVAVPELRLFGICAPLQLARLIHPQRDQRAHDIAPVSYTHLKRARAYWFLNVEVTDEPHTFEYSVENYGTDFVYLSLIHIF